MSFAFAGALAGAGKALQEIAEEKRRLANDILKMEAAGRIKATRAGGGKGGGSKGGSSSRGLSNSDEVRIEKEYENLFGDTTPEERPSLLEFKGKIIEKMNGGASRQEATSLTAGEWGAREVETGEMEKQGIWDRITGAEPKPKMETRYGFNSALSDEAPSPAPSPAPAPAPEAAPSAPPAQSNQGIDPTAALEEARRVIAQGADRNKVIERLRSMGIDPKGL